jgi:hypothetical protein
LNTSTEILAEDALMSTYRKVFVRCRFARGGFSHERTFLIQAPSGGYYRGIAYIGYCRIPDGTPLPSSEPPEGETVEGLLEARVVDTSDEGQTLTVNVPDGGVCDIAATLIDEDSARVLVQP